MEDLSAFSARPRLAALLDHFAEIADARQGWKVMYPLREVLFLVVCGTIASGDDYDDVVDWGKAHLAFLRGFAEFHFGIPCADWLRCVMNRIDPKLFMECFSSWVAACWPDKLDLVAIDGKTSRRTHTDDFVVLCRSREEAEAALAEVRAFATDNGRLHPDKTHVGDCRKIGHVAVPSFGPRMVCSRCAPRPSYGPPRLPSWRAASAHHGTGPKRPEMSPVVREKGSYIPLPHLVSVPRSWFAGSRASALRPSHTLPRLWLRPGPMPAMTRGRCKRILAPEHSGGILATNSSMATSKDRQRARRQNRTSISRFTGFVRLGEHDLHNTTGDGKSKSV